MNIAIRPTLRQRREEFQFSDLYFPGNKFSNDVHKDILVFFLNFEVILGQESHIVQQILK